MHRSHELLSMSLYNDRYGPCRTKNCETTLRSRWRDISPFTHYQLALLISISMSITSLISLQSSEELNIHREHVRDRLRMFVDDSFLKVVHSSLVIKYQPQWQNYFLWAVVFPFLFMSKDSNYSHGRVNSVRCR